MSLIVLCFNITNNFAQIKNTYGFTQSNEPFTPISGGVILGVANNDDQSFTGTTTASTNGIGFPIGFTFTYNGQPYDFFSVNSNGWIKLDTGLFNTPSSYTPLSSGNVNHRQVISAFAGDLQGKAGIGELSYLVQGVSPNQTLTVQWLNYAKYLNSSNLNDTLNFQIRLNESSNQVDIIYGVCKNGTGTRILQVGINGATQTDFLNRSTATDWNATIAGTLNNAICSLTTTVTPSNGLKFSYFLLSGDITPPSIANISVNPTAGCLAVPHTITADVSDASGIDSAVIVYTVNGILQPSILMSGVAGVYSGIIPAAGNALVSYSIVATDSGANSIVGNQFGGIYQDDYLALLTGADQLLNTGETANLTSCSPLSSSIRITEVILFNTGTGGQTVYPSYFPTGDRDDNIEITNLGSVAVDISGYKIHYVTLTGNFSFTFPQGTILDADSIASIHIRNTGGINDSANRFFQLTGAFGPSSGSNIGYYLACASGTVIDAIALNNFVFPGTTPVTSSDFSGPGVVSLGGFAGTQLLLTDSNTNAGWAQSSASNLTTQGLKNIGLTTVVPLDVTWTGGLLGSSIIGENITTPIHPTVGTFTYVASITDGVCISYDTTLINVISPTTPVADFSVNILTGTTGGIKSTFVFTDLSTNIPTNWNWSFNPNTVTFVNGTNASSQNPQVTLDSVALYTVTLISGNPVGLDTIVKPNLLSATLAFCVSAATNTTGTDIGKFAFGGLVNGVDTPITNNSSSINTYSNFTSISSFNVAKGSTVNYAVSQINSAGAAVARVIIFIDYDNNGIFDPATETFATGATITANQVFSGSGNIPNSATLGNRRLRVILRQGTTNPLSCGTYSNGETEDYTINITPPAILDAGVVSIDSPSTSCSLSGAELITITVANNGSSPITNLNVGYTINGGGVVNEIISATIPGSSNFSYTFSSPANFITAGSYSLKTFVSFPGDANLSNDTLTKIIINSLPINAFPYTQNFSTLNGWDASQVSGIGLWEIRTTMTAPVLNPVFGTGFAYFNSFSFSNGTQSRFQVPCGFDFSTLLNPRVELYVSQDIGYTTNADYIAVDVSTDNGLTYTTVDSIFRYNSSYTTPGFIKFETSLGAYAGQNNVIVALRALSRFGNNMAVDQFRIFEPAPFDIALVSVDSLVDGCNISATSQINVTLKNVGTNPVTSTSISFQVDGGTPITETANIFIDTDSTVTYLFTATANFSASGIHVIKAYTSLLLDGDLTNDTASASLEAYPTAAIPTVNNASVCSGASTSLTASGTAASFNWYDSLTGGNLLFTGPVYTVSPTVATSYYIEGINAVSYSVGPIDTTIGAFSLQPPVSAGLIFDVLQPSTLDSVAVFPGLGGLVNIELRNAANVVLATYSDTIIGNTGKQFIPLNFILLPGNGYKLVGASGSIATLQRNSDGTSFPYSNPAVVITNGTLVGLYYYFYDWQVTSVGCPSPRATAQVSINTAPVVNLGANQSICVGSTVVLDAGNAGNSYVWSTGVTTQTISVSIGGTYSVIVTGANGCTATDAITITAGALPIVNLGADVGLCPGANLTLNAGNAGSIYVWSTGATTQTINVIAAGIYSVTVTNATGCVATDAVTINASPAAVSTFTSSQSGISQTVTFTPTNATGTHLWTFGLGGPTSTLASPSYAFTPYGVYQVTHTFTTPDGCSSTTVQLVTVLNVGIKDKFISSFSYQVYPNPIQTETTLSYELKDRSQVQVNVYDVLGRKVFEAVNATQMNGKHEIRLSTDKFTSGAGVYEIQLMVNGTSETLRLIKAE